mgnify:FL=1
MKVSTKEWVQATENLNKRRQSSGHSDDNRSLDNAIRDYKSHLNKCGVGSSVPDVGCGSQFLRQCLDNGVSYTGIDAFPISSDTINLAIEDVVLNEDLYDTVCAFAVLDNCRDFYLACENMKRIARQNVIILTGIGIEVDEYHTHKLEHEHFDKAFADWDCTHKEEISPKVWLLCYVPK